MATTIARETEHLEALSVLTLAHEKAAPAAAHVASLDDSGRAALIELADSHHVVVRSLRAIQSLPHAALDLWLTEQLAKESTRITNALQHLERVCTELERAGCPTVVMKSLDHTPDLGNDLDLYTTADEQQVRAVFVEKLGAHIEPRSWGDRLAHKWNFTLPGLRESVEVHAQRLGQTGEHIAMARRFVERRTLMYVGGHRFWVPAPEERILVAVLQHMYRHFYFRVCDIVNSAELVESGELDYAELRRAADLGGIWPGTATYLKIVSGYVERYCGRPLSLPDEVLRAAHFGAEKLHIERRFLRIPLMFEGAGLYTRQVAATALRGDVPATFRLSLLPPLAATAAVAFKITGDDKGIW